jgi:hypothetical protein
MGVEWVGMVRGDSLERSLHRGHRGRGHNHVDGVGWMAQSVGLECCEVVWIGCVKDE